MTLEELLEDYNRLKRRHSGSNHGIQQESTIPGTVEGSSDEHAATDSSHKRADEKEQLSPKLSSKASAKALPPSSSRDSFAHTPAHTAVDVVASTQKSSAPLSEFAMEMEFKYGQQEGCSFARFEPEVTPVCTSGWARNVLHQPQLKQFMEGDEAKPTFFREPRERKANWNEVFFDLVFVVIFEKMGHDMEHYHLGMRVFFEFCVLFIAAWQIWTQVTYYVNRTDPRDIMHKLYYFVQMLCLMGMAINQVTGVICVYLLSRGCTLVLLLYLAYHDKRARHDALLHTVIFLVSSVPWVVSLIFEKEDHIRVPTNVLLLWAAGLLLEFVGQVISTAWWKSYIPFNIEHLCERFGLFTILCMGEQVANLLFLDKEATLLTYVVAAGGGLVTFGTQILYYDVEALHQKRHALRRHRMWGLAWIYTHLFLQLAIVTVGVGNSMLLGNTYIEDYNPEQLDQVIAWKEGAGEHVDRNQVFTIDSGHAIVLIAGMPQRIVFLGAQAAVFLCLFIIALLHQGKDNVNIRKRYRVPFRFIGFVLMLALLGGGESVSVVVCMVVPGLYMIAIAIIEVIGAQLLPGYEFQHALAAETARGHAAHNRQRSVMLHTARAGKEVQLERAMSHTNVHTQAHGPAASYIVSNSSTPTKQAAGDPQNPGRILSGNLVGAPVHSRSMSRASPQLQH